MDVSEVVYNQQGIEVKRFFNGRLIQGNHQFIWNGKDDNGNNLPGGIYYCQIIAGTKNIIKKLILIR